METKSSNELKFNCSNKSFCITLKKSKNKHMKKLLTLIFIIVGISGCENQKQEWPDFETKTVYFPFQTPIRTLSFGEDRIDNSLDKELAFDIGIVISGMYDNKQNWNVDYNKDNNLLSDSVFGNNRVELKAMPENYYTLSPLNTITIPKGSFTGRIRIQLTDDFLNDPLALTGQYVIPLVITGTSADSILTGNPAVPNPDRRINTDWFSRMAPKDWVLFAVKYINAYEGSWLQRGRMIAFLNNNPVDTITYRALHVERDKVVTLRSLNTTKAVTNFIADRSSEDGDYAMILEFSNMWGRPGGQIEITPEENALYQVSGTGQYYDKENSSESWIGLKWQSMHLNYTYDDGTYFYQVNDTLVFRDRGIKFEEHNLTIVK